MVRVHIARGKLKGYDVCWISVTMPKEVDVDVAYAEYVKQLDKCNARIGILTTLDIPLHIFLTLLRATAEVLGNAAIALSGGIRIVYSDGLFKPGELLK